MKVRTFLQKGSFELVAFIMGHFQVSLLPFWSGKRDRWRYVWLHLFLLTGRKKKFGARLRYCFQYIRWNVALVLKIGLVITKHLLRLNGGGRPGWIVWWGWHRCFCNAWLEPRRSKCALGAAGQLACFQKGEVCEVVLVLVFYS